ncbi:MAG: nucleotidyltransferase domain-containing protein [Thermostichus sp. DG02_5_bins_236]
MDRRYWEYWQQAQARQLRSRQQAADQAWKEVAQMAQVLRQDFGASRVVVFGSLAKGRFAEESDIDLAVAGIPKERFFEALAKVNRHSRRWVDLKPLEDLDPYFCQRILQTGIELDENSE